MAIGGLGSRKQRIAVAAGVGALVLVAGAAVAISRSPDRETSVAAGDADRGLTEDGADRSTTTIAVTTSTSGQPPPATTASARPRAAKVAAPATTTTAAPEVAAPERCEERRPDASLPVGVDVIGIGDAKGLREVSLDGGATYPITASAARSYPHARWSPTGRYVAHVRDDGLAVTDLVTNCWRIVATGGHVDTLDWSPDEKQIGFRYNPQTSPRSEERLHTMQRDGTRRTDLAAVVNGPAWAPDGSGRIAYHDREGMKVRDATGKVSVVHRATTTEFAAWSPDAKRIAFTISVDNGVWVADANGTAGTKLTKEFAPQIFSSSWSPDGSKLAYAYQGNVWTMNADGSDARALTTDQEAHGKPHWSPGGTRIAFMSGGAATTGATILTVAATGGESRVVAESAWLFGYFRRPATN
ncbi:MAG TPA: DPP IV N-terminal domain-containing protein [Acidimicrobiales bacterium]